MRSLFIAISIVAGCFLVGVMLSGNSTGQVPVVPGLTEGRYHAALVQTNSGQEKVLVCDTATGQCWIYYSGPGTKWHDLRSPVAAENAK
jgi:hypothetical protein